MFKFKKKIFNIESENLQKNQRYNLPLSHIHDLLKRKFKEAISFVF